MNCNNCNSIALINLHTEMLCLECGNSMKLPYCDLCLMHPDHCTCSSKVNVQGYQKVGNVLKPNAYSKPQVIWVDFKNKMRLPTPPPPKDAA